MDQLNIKTRLLTDPVEQTSNPLHKVDRYYNEGNATTLLSTFKRGLLPMKRAPRTCNTGISNGKLNGVIIATGPYGQRRPVLCCPAWFPGTAKDLARKRTCSQ
jgi:hypothetical protein